MEPRFWEIIVNDVDDSISVRRNSQIERAQRINETERKTKLATEDKKQLIRGAPFAGKRYGLDARHPIGCVDMAGRIEPDLIDASAGLPAARAMCLGVLQRVWDLEGSLLRAIV